MKKIYLLLMTLTLLLAACGTSGTMIVDPPVAPTLTKLDATVDLTRAVGMGDPSMFQGWKPSGETFYLIATNGASTAPEATAPNVLAQTRLGADGHARLDLPTADTVAPFLEEVTPTADNQANLDCTVSNFKVEPKTFFMMTANPVLSTKIPDINLSYVGLISPEFSGGLVKRLFYIDRNVEFNSDISCLINNEIHSSSTKIKVLKGWNVIKASFTRDESASIKKIITTVESLPVTSSTVALSFVNGGSAPAPRP